MGNLFDKEMEKAGAGSVQPNDNDVSKAARDAEAELAAMKSAQKGSFVDRASQAGSQRVDRNLPATDLDKLPEEKK